MDITQIKSSLTIWLACIPMVVVIVAQAALFFRLARKRAKELQIPDETVKAGCRSACITAVGPTLASVIMLFSLMATFGTPISWKAMCDIGAGRSELGISAMCQGLAPANADAGTILSYGLWGMAIMDMGWVIVALLFTNRFDAMVATMNRKFNPAWVKVLMGCTMVSMFSYVLANATVGKSNLHYIAAFSSAITMLLLRKFVKNKRLQELSLGIAMVVGMTVATVIRYQFAG